MSEGLDIPGAASAGKESKPQTPPQPTEPSPTSSTPYPAPPVSPLARLQPLAPPGGRGGLFFWSGLCFFLAVAAFLFHTRLSKSEQSNREAQEQLQLFVSDNQKLRSEVDRLQTELSREGSLLRNREQILRETTESLQDVQARADQAGKAAEARRLGAEALRAALDKAIPNDPDIQVVTAPGDAATAPRVIIRIGTGLLFDPGETVPNAKGAPLLKTVAAAISTQAAQKLPAAVAVEAHFDSTPLKSTNAWDLTSTRAGAVVKALTDSVPSLATMKIAAQGFADTRPLVPNDSPDHTKNRRVEIVLTVGD
ncbi:OmpA family protein [Verrucomicrobium sp. GAS474]|uniref:OmpA family protein n=1 Tax=Verrucomicrobium sp. GAS474 TaxID=1882831 RepID=UPI00087AAD32|nr:OmpA family protein [Verrucomicrobium sp. GAS474]SDT87189.1 OmpA family protein [Verrucomicrobium sp. GAS474]